MLILSVTQINTYLSFKFKEDKKLSGVMVRGEISNFTAHRSGHFYFTLKDEQSALKAIMFRSSASRLKFMPEDGMKVILMGNISVFERDGVYQIYVTDIVPEGAGAVHIAAEQLKEKLRKEGIFDPDAKRPLPPMPKKIGVVTSGTGAALQDIINVLSRRYPLGELVLFPALVQGEAAPDSIAEALIKASRTDCDSIILARGGGSAEDLSAFNTEKVAYAVFNSSIPVISAVGHETDLTIADMAADLRAPTPSAAAEMVSLSAEQLRGNIAFYEDKLSALIKRNTELMENRLTRLNDRLMRYSPDHRIDTDISVSEGLSKAMKAAFKETLLKKEKELLGLSEKIEALSPVRVLERGYSLVYRNGIPVTKGSELLAGDLIEIRMSDKTITAVVGNMEEK